MFHLKEHGYLELAIGCMFSGKTSHIINLYKQYTLCHLKVCVVNYEEDTRYSETHLMTHDGQAIECIKTTELTNLPIEYDVYLINEAQFFPDTEVLIKIVDDFKKIVHCCGLDGDYKRHKFGNWLDLIPHADNVVKLKAICVRCRDGTPAIFTHRKVGGDVKLIGGAELYEPLCRNCYLSA
jgi:thymidine kinase